jgi:hypothetical protein
MIIPMWVKAIAMLVLVAVGFGAGWRTKGAFVAERDLATLEARNEMVNTFRSLEGEVSKTVEAKLAGLRANERVIEHEKIKLVDRPVYNSECLDADGVALIERARKGVPDAPAD